MANQKQVGLTSLRAKTAPAPTHSCANCKCMRYTPCGCMLGPNSPPRKAVVEETQAPA